MNTPPSTQDILAALEARNTAGITLWLDNGLSPKWGDAAGNSLLHYAASWGDVGFVTTLLTKGADVHAVNSSGEAPDDVARAFGWDHLAVFLQAQAKAGYKAAPVAFPFQSLTEIRQSFQSTGINPIETAIRTEQFARVIDLACKDADGLSAADLLAQGALGESLLLKICHTGQLPLLMKPELWIKKPAEFQTLWAEIPEHFRKQVDYTTFINGLHRAKIQSRPSPKLGKGP